MFCAPLERVETTPNNNTITQTGEIVKTDEIGGTSRLKRRKQPIKKDFIRRKVTSRGASDSAHRSHRRKRDLFHGKTNRKNASFNTVIIGYCDYHPVTKSPKIGSCD